MNDVAVSPAGTTPRGSEFAPRGAVDCEASPDPGDPRGAEAITLPAAGLIRLLRLTSAALPVGTFAYSHGLESAVSAGWVRDATTALAWIEGVLRASVCACDVPVLLRIYRAVQGGDDRAVKRWNAWLFATRATSELQAEDRQLGTSLARLVAALGHAAAAPWASATNTTYLCVFALAAHHAGIEPQAAALGYASAWCEAQVGAAVRLVPLGQTQGQTVLARLEPAILQATARGLELGDDQISCTSPGHALASAIHETQYSRLFRS